MSLTTDTIRYGLMAGVGGVRAFHKRCFWGFNEHCPGKKEVRLFGITDLVKKHFFHQKWSPMAISGNSSRDRNIQGGSERGKKVDQQVTKWHRLKSDPKTRPSTLDKFRLKADRYTNMVLDALESKGWTILATQVPVGNVDARLGTAVDIKCRDRDGRIILIELKCGYNGVFDMRWPACKEWAWCVGNMRHLPANARTYSLIQMAWTWVLHNRSASGPKANLAYVLHISDDGPAFHQLDLALVDLLLPRFRDLEKKRVYRFQKLTVAKKTWQRKKKTKK